MDAIRTKIHRAKTSISNWFSSKSIIASSDFTFPNRFVQNFVFSPRLLVQIETLMHYHTIIGCSCTLIFKLTSDKWPSLNFNILCLKTLLYLQCIIESLPEKKIWRKFFLIFSKIETKMKIRIKIFTSIVQKIFMKWVRVKFRNIASDLNNYSLLNVSAFREKKIQKYFRIQNSTKCPT